MQKYMYASVTSARTQKEVCRLSVDDSTKD